MFSSFILFSQKNPEPLDCGIKSEPGAYKKDRFFGNNQKLVDILLDNKVNIETDYMKNVMEGTAKMVMNQSRFTAESYKRNIPIKAWIYKNNSGTGNISSNQVNQIVGYLNNLYTSNTNINFYLLCDIGVVNNTAYNNNGSQYFNTYIANNRTQGAINVHFVKSAGWAGQGTWPWDNPNFSCAVKTDYSPFGVNESKIANTLAHEIGHTLGLYHTHHPGRDDNSSTNENCGNCFQEAVSRSKRQGIFCVSTIDDFKCEVNGDFLCDTEADPVLSNRVDSNCDFTYNGTDNWGDTWAPEVKNIMGYANPKSCRFDFTPLQVGKMYGYVDDIGINFPTFDISGPTSICAGQTATYTVNTLPGVTEYTWDPPYNMNILSGQGTNSVTVEAVSDFGGVIKVTPNCGTKTARFKILDIFTIDIDGYDQACPLFTYTYTAPDFPSASYDWSVTHGYVVSGNGTNEVEVALTAHSSGETILDVEVTGLCDGSVFGQKTIVHGDPPPPAQQCFSPRPNGEKPEIEKHTDSILAMESGILSIENDLPLKFTGDIELYPNPASGNVTVVSPSIGTFNVILHDILGQTLFKEKILFDSQKYSIDLKEYPAGIYWVKLVNEGQIFTKTLIIKN